MDYHIQLIYKMGNLNVWMRSHLQEIEQNYDELRNNIASYSVGEPKCSQS